MEPTAFDTIKVLLAQIAAESYLDGSGSLEVDGSGSLEDLYKLGANRGGDGSGMTKSTGLMWDDFESNYTLVNHRANTSSGFSGTLLKDKASGEYVLSFRSTESKLETLALLIAQPTT